jgi:hypothetical protein
MRSEFLVNAADETGFNRYTILNLHAILVNNLLSVEDAAGRLWHIAVGIERSAFHPLTVPQQIEEYFDQILATSAAIEDPSEQVFFIMVQLPYLQPFDDVNKRVSRLAAKHSLHQTQPPRRQPRVLSSALDSGKAAWPLARRARVLVLCGIPIRRRKWRTIHGLPGLLLAFGGFSTCGGGGRGGGGSGNPGMASGTYTFTVTGTGNPVVTPAPTTTFTLTVD